MSFTEKELVINKSTKPRYLTKSRFKIGLECPTKLYYTGKPQYPNQSLTDSFLEALAQGGYQVGELAKHYYPGGHDIKSLDYEVALKKTEDLLKQDKVIIYEAAIRYQNLFIRVDILVKNGNHFDLFEVKSKSFEPGEDRFMKKNGKGLLAEWAPYLHDVAFQHFVIANAYSNMNVDAYLMLVNKAIKASTDGLNTKFKIIKAGNNRKEIEVSSSLTEQDLNPRLLQEINVKDEIEHIYKEEDFNGQGFESHISQLASIYEDDIRIQGNLKKACKKCEFYCSREEEKNGLVSGYKECWTSVLNWDNEDMEESLVTDIWNLRSANKLIEQKKYKIADLEEGDIQVKEDNRPGLSVSQRQWLQVEKTQANDTTAYIDADNLRAEMDKWIYPLHFIDFETSATAIPFTSGMAPYEGVAFQFSHHVVHEGGRIEHAGQFLDSTTGHFPNFDFLRNLRDQLGHDEGTIFKYSNHENTYLNKIFWQLKDSPDLSTEEINDLCDFIKSITHSTGNSSVNWQGPRDMVDLWQLVKRYYYDPHTKGSNSIKQVLPAILNSSDYIKNKYSMPIYGAGGGIPSQNFKDHVWVTYEGSEVRDPYVLLPKLFDNLPGNIDDLLSDDDGISTGGAAMTAYAKMQFTDMSTDERERLSNGLLRYCELDSLAMVMIFEAWKDWISKRPL